MLLAGLLSLLSPLLILLLRLPLLMLMLVLVVLLRPGRFIFLAVGVSILQVRREKDDRRSALPATDTSKPALRLTNASTTATTEIQGLLQTFIVDGQTCKACSFDVKSRSYFVIVRVLSAVLAQQISGVAHIKGCSFSRGRGRRDCEVLGAASRLRRSSKDPLSQVRKVCAFMEIRRGSERCS